MVDTKTKIIASGFSALLVGFIHYAAHNWVFNNPALEASNKTLVGITVTVAVFIIAYLGMGWKE